MFSPPTTNRLLPTVSVLLLLLAPLAPATSLPLASAAEPPANAPAAKGTDKNETILFDGKSLDRWRIVDKDYYADHGKTYVKEGVIVLEKGMPGTGISVKGETPKMNYELTLSARRDQGDDFFCGITFPIEKDHVTLILGGWGGGTTGISNVDDFSADENETSNFVEFKNGQWYKVRLRVTPTLISAWVDQKQIVNLDPRGKRFSIWFEQEAVRPLGIGAWYTAASLKDIRLRRLDPPEQSKPGEKPAEPAPK